MRALLQERWYEKQAEKLPVGKIILYFGCQEINHDFLYEDELKHFHEQHLLTHLHVACNRETNEKIHVQHLLAQHGYDTWDLIYRQNASVYVCGDSKMGMNVSTALTKIFAEVGGLGNKSSPAYMENLQAKGRFIKVIWD